MAHASEQSDKPQAIIDLMVISEIMVVLAAHAITGGSTVPASWMMFLGCAVANAADRLAEDGT